MTDPENFMASERAEARDARWSERDPLTGLFPAVDRAQRNLWTGEWQPVPSRAEAEHGAGGL